MKTLNRILLSCFALVATPLHATDVAKLPLKASVLAKPNVIFAMDDSGSMDAEVMIDGNRQAYVYLNYGSTNQYPGGKPRDGSVSQDFNMFYLFPNGGGTGNKVSIDPSTGYSFALAPIPELAWTRSSAYNTVYYDPNKTYKPWSPAYVRGTLMTFTDANPAAAKSHPTLGTTTVRLDADLTNTNTDWRFGFMPGQTIPAGATNVACYFSAFPGALPYTVDTTRGLCKAAMTYYPATYWQREACVVNGTSCVTNFDGNTLKRYEIRPGNTFPSGRLYADEMKNFANWFTYHRKRRLLLGGAMGEVLEGTTGIRMGVVAFNNRVNPALKDAEATAASDNRLAVAGIFYDNEGAGGTPTNATQAFIWDRFNAQTDVVQYACQRNASFIITDGFSNDAFSAPPAYTAATYGNGQPYETITVGSLADKALAHFTLQLRTDLPAGRVPLGPQTGSNPDPNTNLHVTTYALTLGMKGTIWPSATDPFVTPPTWPTPVSNTATMIDDLWHATINGRGEMYLATDTDATVLGIQSALNAILAQTGAQGGIAVSTVNLSRGDNRAYFGTYNPAGWAGDLTANPIDPTTAVVSTTPTWSASQLLTARNWTTRVIAAGVGGSATGFTAGSVGSIVNPGGIYGTDNDVIDYLRGDRTHEGTQFRTRTSLMGAIINSEPTVSREDGVVYVQSGEGMLHAVDTVGTDAGKELWAFVPESALANIGETVPRAYAFRTKLDGSPVVGKLSGGGKILVAGAGVAGRSFYALDVSNPRGLTEAGLAGKHLWTFPAAGNAALKAKVGDAMGRPLVVKSSADGDVVLLTSGYNNTSDGKGRVWMLNATTGALIHEFTVSAGAIGTESGLTHIRGFLESDGTVRYAYGGDLLGNVWRFDLTAKTAPDLLAVLKGPSGAVQSVTAAPELVMVKGRRVVLIGTGRLLDISDFGNSAVQTFYAIADGGTLANARAGLVQRVYNPATDTLSGSALDWSTDRGWYLDLPSGQHANTRPTLAYGAVAFTTNSNGGSSCAADARLWVIDLLTGGAYADAGYVSSVISTTANTSGVTALLTKDGKLIGSGQDADGQPWQRDITSGSPIDPAKNSWRELRRQ